MCFSQFFPLWVSKTCFSQDGIYRGKYRVPSKTLQTCNGQDWDLQIWCLNASFAVVQLHTPHACAPCYRLQPSLFIHLSDRQLYCISRCAYIRDLTVVIVFRDLTVVIIFNQVKDKTDQQHSAMYRIMRNNLVNARNPRTCLLLSAMTWCVG